MRRAGLVRTRSGDDARSKTVVLTPKAKRIVGQLSAEWRATEAALSELEAELPYPLTRVVGDIEAALERRTFYVRVEEKLDEDPSGGEQPVRYSGCQGQKLRQLRLFGDQGGSRLGSLSIPTRRIAPSEPSSLPELASEVALPTTVPLDGVDRYDEKVLSQG